MKLMGITLLILVTLSSCSLSQSSTQISKFNVMDIMKQDKCQTLNGKFMFIFKSKTNPNPEYPLNRLDYKFVQLTKKDLIIYKARSQDPRSSNGQDTTNYIMTFKLRNIDLPCNDYLYVCTPQEFRAEYLRKLKGVDFKLNKQVEGRFGAEEAGKNCLLITQGSFDSLDELPYLCFDTFEQLVYYQNILSERIIQATLKRYDGVLEMLNSSHNKFQPTVFNLKKMFLTVNNGLYPENDKYKEYLKVDYPKFNGYSLVLLTRDEMPWEGDKASLPDLSRCFKIEYKLDQDVEKSYFCVFYDRNDMTRKFLINNIKSSYVNDIWVSRINMKLHILKLGISHEKIVRAVGPLDCNSHVMEPIKFEIRMRYLVMRHRIHQLVLLRRYNFVTGLKKVDEYKKKIITAACTSSELCVQAINLCLRKGFLPLRLKGYQVAMSLQNPYLVLDPKVGVAVREGSKKSVGLQLVKTAEKLLGINTKNNIVVDNPLVTNLPDVPRPAEIERAMNTYMKVFGGSKVKSLENSGKFCKHYATGSLKNLKRKVDILAITGINEPFFEYLGFIRDKQFITK